MKKKFRFTALQWIYLLIGLLLLSSYSYVDARGFRLFNVLSNATWTHAPIVGVVRHK